MQFFFILFLVINNINENCCYQPTFFYKIYNNTTKKYNNINFCLILIYKIYFLNIIN